MPAPNVDSAVIRLNIRKEAPVQVDSERAFFSLVKAAFGQRRKTLLNSVSAGLGMPKPQIEEAMNAAGIPLTARAEQLSLEMFAALSNALKKNAKGESENAG